MHWSSRSSAGNKRARGVPLLFFRTFRQTVWGVCVWPQPCRKVVDGQVRGVVCDAAAQADIQVQDLFDLPSASETAGRAETAGSVMTRLIERNTKTPKDEANKQIDTKDSLENFCDKLVDDSGDARETSLWQCAPRMRLCQHRTASRTQSGKICLAVEQGFHLPGSHHVRMLCRLPVSLRRGLLKCSLHDQHV